jgi:hypothetical protein
MENKNMSKRAATTTELNPAFTVPTSALATSEETRAFKKLLPILAEIRKKNKLIGFTLKNSTRAMIDLDKKEDLTQLSLLANQLFDSSAKLLNACKQGSMKSAVLEGSKMRVLCLSVSGNQISVFMEKTVDYDRIVEKLAEADI